MVKYERRPRYLLSCVTHRWLLSIPGVRVRSPPGGVRRGCGFLSLRCMSPLMSIPAGGLHWGFLGWSRGLPVSWAGPSLKVISSSALVDSVAAVLIGFLFKLHFRRPLGKREALKRKPFISEIFLSKVVSPVFFHFLLAPWCPALLNYPLSSPQ